jgi:hypothetical protein
MTDRELLEAAAKAAGVEGHFCARKELDTERWGIVTFLGFGQAAFWNPLENDGDALRLAIKLRISLIHEEEYMGGPVMETIEAITTPRAGGGRHCETMSLNFEHDDAMANTRRAIVRAAAAIGSSGEREG